jgi:hypothetical protein
MIISFKGIVRRIEFINECREKITLVDIDPKWAISVYIDSVATEKHMLKAGETIIFGIHSPTRLFAESDINMIIGKTMNFELTYEYVLESGSTFKHLKVK